MSEASGAANIVNFEVLGRHVSEGSKAAYLREASKLWRAYGNTGSDQTHEGFAQWLLGRKPTLRGATWRVYRRSVEYWLEAENACDAARQIMRQDAVAPTVNTLAKKGAPRRAGALKAKRIPEADFQKLATYLRVFCKSDNALLSLQWLHACILTGARPSEWENAVLDGHALTLTTAKAGTWRCTGPSRTLDISGMSDTDVAVVRAMVDAGETMRVHGTYDLMQDRVSAVLYAACQRVWPKGDRHYSLYSARHQGTANLKGSLPLRQVSAVLGHISTLTAARSYGRRSSAWDPSVRPAPPVPTEDDVETVRLSPGASYKRQPKSKIPGGPTIGPNP